jgi:hypothetical protein
MNNRQIVIVTDVFDVHADRIIEILRERDREPVRLNYSDVPDNVRLSCVLGGREWRGEIEILTNDRVIETARVGSVWWRKPGPFKLPGDLIGQERVFAAEELRHAMDGLWNALDCLWVSRPEAIRRAGYKIEQLDRAARLGFAVPRTVVTTDPGAVRAFHRECHGDIVFKVLTEPYLAARTYLETNDVEDFTPLVTPTTRITEAELEMLDAVRTVPCQFQELLPRRSELRVTVIGEEVFAAELRPDDPGDAPVDWRDAETTYRPADPPGEVAERCLRLTRGYGLNFAAIDLAVTPDDRYVFLEINPNGQFLYVEDRVPELRMGEAMATLLTSGVDG